MAPASKSRDTYYLTTAISYPNGAPHIGHAYERDRHRCTSRASSGSTARTCSS
ncbi:MAG: hypothetical protein MZV49_26225 [Rhodopseudomonas palustris]|nr:hypothetical protein [Rhodopseudomonas palustris]